MAWDSSSRSERAGWRVADGRMIQRNPKSITMFTEDFDRTYGRIETRTKEIMEEEGDREQIQLVAEDPNVEIGFNLPDGPPPENLRLEGEHFPRGRS